MSKVYEALQHARAERHLIVPAERDGTFESGLPEILDIQSLPPLRMEREMRRLHQSLIALLPVPEKGMVQFIGSRKNEGTSTIVHEFGRFLAENVCRSVLLVDADPYGTSHFNEFGPRSTKSLQQVISEGGSYDQAMVHVGNSRLFVCRLYDGATKNGQPDVYLTNRDLLNKVRMAFDFVLIDSSPIGTAVDALSLCSSVDGVVLVVEAEKTRSQVISNTKQRVIQSGGTIIGLVFNKQRHYIPEWIYKKL